MMIKQRKPHSKNAIDFSMPVLQFPGNIFFCNQLRKKHILAL